MKLTMNFTLSEDDLNRYESANDLRAFYSSFGLDGLEVMPLAEDDRKIVTPDMIVGVHARCITDWMGLDTDMLLSHYRQDLDYARQIGARYVVFHITQVGFAESLTYELVHTDEEVVDAAAAFINQLLDGQDYNFYFLMENLWWPGMTMVDPNVTRRLLDQVHYPKKGIMLDTGHFMSTDTSLTSPQDALDALNRMLDAHGDLVSMIKGVHLNLSLSGEYVKNYRKHPVAPETDPEKLAAQAFSYIFQIDQHRPFATPGVRDLIDRISPMYVTLEYITRDRAEHAHFLKEGTDALSSKTG